MQLAAAALFLNGATSTPDRIFFRGAAPLSEVPLHRENRLQDCRILDADHEVHFLILLRAAAQAAHGREVPFDVKADHPHHLITFDAYLVADLVGKDTFTA